MLTQKSVDACCRGKDAMGERIAELEKALQDIAGASWGTVPPHGPRMTAKALTIDRARKALGMPIEE